MKQYFKDLILGQKFQTESLGERVLERICGNAASDVVSGSVFTFDQDEVITLVGEA